MKAEDVVIGETYWTHVGPVTVLERSVHKDGVLVDHAGCIGRAAVRHLRNTATDAELDAAFEAMRAANAGADPEFDIICPHCGGLWDSAPHSYFDYRDDTEAKCEGDGVEGRGDCGGYFAMHRVPGGWRTEPAPADFGVHFAVNGVHCERCDADLSGKASVHEAVLNGKSWCFACSQAPQDAPSYGGWSEGDVMAYLSRFGEVEQNAPGDWEVNRGELFSVLVQADETAFLFTLTGFWDEAHELVKYTDDITLGMQWAVERWRKLAAESDPSEAGGAPLTSYSGVGVGSGASGLRTADGKGCRSPDGSAGAEDNTRHILTGDLGGRTEYGAGWHDVEEG